ncbi:MAG: hypothetical protein SGJ23_11820 [Alphaproteobacteria bacterium]|nr:hypothetical protein [Alphaproteobacteria bacterium]
MSDTALDRAFVARCRPALAVDPTDLTLRGGIAIVETRHGVEVRRARDHAGHRPWSGRLRRIDE